MARGGGPGWPPGGDLRFGLVEGSERLGLTQNGGNFSTFRIHDI